MSERERETEAEAEEERKKLRRTYYNSLWRVMKGNNEGGRQRERTEEKYYKGEESRFEDLFEETKVINRVGHNCTNLKQ